MIGWLRNDRDAPSIALGDTVLPLELTRTARARRLTMRLAPDGSAVRITLPRWCPSADAVAFAKARRAWLEGQLARIPRREDPVMRGWLRFRGEELAIDWRSDASRTPRLEPGRLIVGGPADTLSRRLERWLRAQALAVMGEDLACFCTRAAVPLPALRLTAAGRRWGSCSSKAIVRINWRLIMAPDAVRRSVVAHEVAHLVHFDHSPAFHAALAHIYDGDIAAADHWLRTQGRGLYAEFG